MESLEEDEDSFPMNFGNNFFFKFLFLEDEDSFPINFGKMFFFFKILFLDQALRESIFALNTLP